MNDKRLSAERIAEIEEAVPCGEFIGDRSHAIYSKRCGTDGLCGRCQNARDLLTEREEFQRKIDILKKEKDDAEFNIYLEKLHGDIDD